MAKPSISLGKLVPGIQRYFGEIAAELKKVVWPTREETTRLAIVVFVIAGSVGLLLGLFDYGFTKLMEAILGA